MEQHPIHQPIREIDVYTDADSNVLCFRVGRKDVTRIEACTKPGLHCDIPYVRVWKGDVCEAEFCQHNIVGVYFAEPEPVAEIKCGEDDHDPHCTKVKAHKPGVFCPDCWIPF